MSAVDDLVTGSIMAIPSTGCTTREQQDVHEFHAADELDTAVDGTFSATPGPRVVRDPERFITSFRIGRPRSLLIPSVARFRLRPDQVDEPASRVSALTQSSRFVSMFVIVSKRSTPFVCVPVSSGPRFTAQLSISDTNGSRRLHRQLLRSGVHQPKVTKHNSIADADIESASRRLSRRLVANGTCLEFSGCRNPKGYGGIGVGRFRWTAHRLAWVLARGPIPHGLCVCHRCDNPPCCNVEHLFLGTSADNSYDASDKGRLGKRRVQKPACS